MSIVLPAPTPHDAQISSQVSQVLRHITPPNDEREISSIRRPTITPSESQVNLSGSTSSNINNSDPGFLDKAGEDVCWSVVENILPNSRPSSSSQQFSPPGSRGEKNQMKKKNVLRPPGIKATSKGEETDQKNDGAMTYETVDVPDCSEEIFFSSAQEQPEAANSTKKNSTTLLQQKLLVSSAQDYYKLLQLQREVVLVGRNETKKSKKSTKERRPSEHKKGAKIEEQETNNDLNPEPEEEEASWDPYSSFQQDIYQTNRWIEEYFFHWMTDVRSIQNYNTSDETTREKNKKKCCQNNGQEQGVMKDCNNIETEVSPPVKREEEEKNEKEAEEQKIGRKGKITVISKEDDLEGTDIVVIEKRSTTSTEEGKMGGDDRKNSSSLQKISAGFIYTKICQDIFGISPMASFQKMWNEVPLRWRREIFIGRESLGGAEVTSENAQRYLADYLEKKNTAAVEEEGGKGKEDGEKEAENKQAAADDEKNEKNEKEKEELSIERKRTSSSVKCLQIVLPFCFDISTLDLGSSKNPQRYVGPVGLKPFLLLMKLGAFTGLTEIRLANNMQVSSVQVRYIVALMSMQFSISALLPEGDEEGLQKRLLECREKIKKEEELKKKEKAEAKKVASSSSSSLLLVQMEVTAPTPKSSNQGKRSLLQPETPFVGGDEKEEEENLEAGEDEKDDGGIKASHSSMPPPKLVLMLLPHVECLDFSQNPLLDFEVGLVLQKLLSQRCFRMKNVELEGTQVRKCTRRSIEEFLKRNRKIWGK